MSAKAGLFLGAFVFVCAFAGNWLFPEMSLVASALLAGAAAAIGAAFGIKIFGSNP